MRLAVLGCFSFLMVAAPVRQQLSFEPNRGQTSREAKFIAHLDSRTVFLTGSGLVVASLAGPALRVELAGSNPDVTAEGLDPQPGTTNHLVATRWAVDVPHFARVRYQQVYPGVDLVYYFNGPNLEHDFVVAPHAAWSRIRFRVEGAQRLRLDASGDLLLETEAGVVRQKKPVIYQQHRFDTQGTLHQQRRRVEGRYVVSGSEYGFEVGEHDPRLPLVIDPVTVFGTYLGGAAIDQPSAIVADAQGNTYVTGSTTSANFPTKGALQPRYGGNTDVFVTKLDAATGAIVYSTYLGGSGIDTARAIRVDAAGSVYVAGSTRSADFPAVRGFQTRLAGPLSAFVLKLNPAGNALVYGTYLNGSAGSVARGLDIDRQGNAYVVGATTSNDFPVKGTNFGKFFRSGIDAFAAKLSADGATLLYSGFLGGGGVDYLEAVSVNGFGEATVVGWTTSTDLPTDNANSRWPRLTGASGGYLAKITATGADLTSSTYFGGSKNDYLTGVIGDKTDAAVVYVTGLTTSPDLPTVDSLPVAVGAGAVPFAAKFAVPGLIIGQAPPQAPPRPGGGDIKPDDRYDWFIPIYNDCNGVDWKPMMDQLKKDQQDLTEIQEFTIASGVGAVNASAGLAVSGLIVAKHVACPAGSKSKELAAGTPYGRLTGINIANAREIEVPQPPESLAGAATLRALAADGAGNIYVALQATDQRLPVTAAGAPPGSTGRTGYVTKISSAGPAGPAIISVTNAFGDSTSIAPNTWVIIKGTNLAPASSARIWQGSDFANNQLPVQLDGVSVKLNGQNAYVWYVSPAQLNILTPPGLTAGPVQVAVTAGGATSATFSSQAAAVSLSLFVFGAGPYATGTHASGAYLGPTSLYPGLTTPAQPGESIILYGNGFGPTSAPVVAGAVTQSGTLSPLPVIQIGGVNATVQFAGLVAPGLYQLNVQVPGSLASGDHAVVVQYGGAATQRGVLVAVQR